MKRIVLETEGWLLILGVSILLLAAFFIGAVGAQEPQQPQNPWAALAGSE